MNSLSNEVNFEIFKKSCFCIRSLDVPKFGKDKLPTYRNFTPMSTTENTLNNLKEKYELLKKETKIVLEPGEQLLLCLNTPRGLSLFLKFLESEYNQENLLGMLEIININLCLNLTEYMTKDIKNKIYNFTQKYLPLLNIEAKELGDLKKECAVIQKWEYTDNFFFRELFKNLEGSLRINLLDPFLRFQKNEQEILNSYTTMMRNKANKIDINDKKGVVLNNFEKWPDNIPIRSAVHVSQDVLHYFLESVNSNQQYWTISSSKVLLNFEKFEQSLKSLTFKQKTIEFTKVSLKDLSDKEKLTFYVNTYNIMMIHSFLYHIPFKSDKKDQEEFRKKVKYVIDGKEISLFEILNFIEKLYYSLTTGYVEVVQFSLVHFRTTSSQIRVLYHESDILEDIEKNCKRFLKDHIEYRTDDAIICLPVVQFLFRSKRKPKKVARRKTLDITDIRAKKFSYNGEHRESTSPTEMKRFQSSGGIKKIEKIETVEEKRTPEEKSKLLSKMKKNGESPKFVHSNDTFEGDTEKLKITLIPSPKLREHSSNDLLSPKRVLKDTKDEFSAKDLLSKDKSENKRKSLNEIIQLKFGNQGDSFHSGNSIDTDVSDMYYYILEKDLTHLQVLEWELCKNFIGKTLDKEETDWICLLNPKNRKEALNIILEDSFFE